MIETLEVAPGRDRMELTVVGDLAAFLSRKQDGNRGSTLMFFFIMRAAISRTEVSGLTVATSRVMTSCAFMATSRALNKAQPELAYLDAQIS
jgi:hypothetical protein